MYILFCWLLFSIGLTYFVAIFIVYDYLFSRCLTTRKEKTDRPPRELIPKDAMKAAGAAVLDGKPVNAVARESGVTHKTLEQYRYVRKSELLQKPSVDQFMPHPKKHVETYSS